MPRALLALCAIIALSPIVFAANPVGVDPSTPPNLIDLYGVQVPGPRGLHIQQCATNIFSMPADRLMMVDCANCKPKVVMEGLQGSPDLVLVWGFTQSYSGPHGVVTMSWAADESHDGQCFENIFGTCVPLVQCRAAFSVTYTLPALRCLYINGGHDVCAGATPHTHWFNDATDCGGMLYFRTESIRDTQGNVLEMWKIRAGCTPCPQSPTN